MSEGGAPPRPAGSLIGRAADVAVVRSFVDGAAVDGGALLLWGDAGIGKTALLDVAATYATQAGTRVVRAAGAEFEADVSFAGLHQLLQPLLDGPPRLSPLHTRALSVALGLADGPPADRLVTSNAALNLLRQTGASQPLLVIVDDLPWLDRASAVVLGFAARRLAGSRVGVLAASRSGEASFFEQGTVPGHEVKPLDDASAAALLEDRFPAMASRVRQRLLADAEGNPLALLELPAALTLPQREAVGALPAVLPLGRRLQAVFASRVDNIPAATRAVLLLAALDGTGDLNVLVPSESARPNVDDLAPAERARLVQVEAGTGRLAFAHPLIRSAVVEQSTSDQRRHAHRVLADRRADQPQRRAWHLAEAAVGPDEDVAALLNRAAHESARRGDAVAAISELLRAAQLSPSGPDRSNRLAKAAYLGAIVTGDLRSMPPLLEAAREADEDRVGSLAGAIAGAYFLLNGDGDVDTAHRLLVGAIETFADRCDAHHQPLIEALYNLLMVCFFGGRPELWEPFHAATSRLAPQPPELLTILANTFSDPARRAQPVLARIDAAVSGLSQETSPARIVRTAIAATYVDRLPDCREPLWRVVNDGRDGGAITSAIEALFLLGTDAFVAGRWDLVLQLTDEGLALCESHSYRLLSCPGRFLRALVAAARGEDDEAGTITDELAGWATPRRVGSVRNYVDHARALMALGNGDFEAAYQHAAAISPAGTLAPHVPHALWVVLELTDAAVRTGRRVEAAAHVAAAREADIASISPRLAFITTASAALAAPDEESRPLFETALDTPAAEGWPFDLARVHLAYGERLRRAKATAQARHHLTAARDIFERLAARPWASRSASELRATGLTIGQPDRSAAASLSPQQLEIALLAASGLTNKQIGEKLFLSHRTVGTHLYQVFPKLGVTSRAALRDALKDLTIEP